MPVSSAEPNSKGVTRSSRPGLFAFVALWGAIFVVAALGLTIYNYRLWNYGADDAYITFRYARNLATGHGLVYNPPDHVLGTTSPFFAILLAILYRGAPVDIPWMAEIVGGVATGLAALLMSAILSRMLRNESPTMPTGISIVFPFLFMMNPMVVRISGMGMETPVFYFLLLLTFELYQMKQRTWCGVAGFCLTLTRPEGVIFMALLFLWDYLVLGPDERGRGALWPYFVYGVLIAAWLIFTKGYYHTWLPTSIEAKKIYFGNIIKYGETTRAEIEREIFGVGWDLNSLWIKARTLLILAGMALLVYKRRPEAVFAVFLGASIAYLYYERMRIFPWYLGPSYLIAYLLIAQVSAFALSQVRFRALASIGAVALLAVAAGFTVSELRRTAGMPPVQHRFFREAADRLNTAKQPDSVLFAEEIGIVGYYSNIRIEDFGGLVSPDLFPYLRNADLKGAMEAVNADFVVFAHPPQSHNPFADADGSAWFDAHYRPLLKMEVIEDARWYALYQRVERAP